MVFDTKTTAGGAVLLLLSSGGAYAATNATKGETSETPSLNGENKEDSKTENKDSKNDQNGREEEAVSGPKAQTETPKKIKDKISEGRFGNVESSETTCTGELEKPYEDKKFKAVILVCFKGKTFKDRAVQLDIQLITSSDQDPSFSKRRTNIGDAVLLRMANDTVAKGIQIQNGQVIDNTLPDFCDKVGKLAWSSITKTSYPIDKEWKWYLKGCAKTENVVKDFWTGQ